LTNRTILHAADIHLDSPLQKLDQYESAPTERIRGASRRALANLTQLAIERDVDLVVIAGDLYDGDWTDQNTGLAFVNEASKLVRAGIPVLVIRGNHDAANQMTSSLPLPTNPDGSKILISDREAETRVFESIGVAVHGQSFQSRAEKRDLAAKYPEPLGGLFNLGLLHTGLEGQSSHAHYAPCTAASLSDRGYDYWALGHIHARRDHGLKDGPPIVFSGNLQGRHIGEQGAKGCVLVEVDAKNRCRHTFQPLDVVRWHECPIDVGQMTHPDEVLDAYEGWLRAQREACEDRLLVSRVRLTGTSSLHQQLHRRREQLRADLQAISVSAGGDGVWLEDVRIRTRAPATQSVSAELEGPLESLTEVLEQLRGERQMAATIEDELKDLAKKLPTELKGDQENAALPFSDTAWLGELLESSAADVLARLQDAAGEAEDEEAAR
jgi:DNA repair exonuclease SbcCD nuclease subunit